MYSVLVHTLGTCLRTSTKVAYSSTSTVHQQQPWPDLLALPLSPSALVTPPEEPDRQPETDGQAAQRNSSEQQRTRASPPPRAPARPTGGFLFPIFSPGLFWIARRHARRRPTIARSSASRVESRLGAGARSLRYEAGPARSPHSPPRPSLSAQEAKLPPASQPDGECEGERERESARCVVAPDSYCDQTYHDLPNPLPPGACTDLPIDARL